MEKEGSLAARVSTLEGDLRTMRKEVQLMRTEMGDGFEHLRGSLDAFKQTTTQEWINLYRRGPFVKMQDQLDQILERVGTMNGRVDGLEHSVHIHDSRLTSVQARYLDLVSRVAGIAAKVGILLAAIAWAVKSGKL